MKTRKNQVDDLLTRFERKSINQKKCSAVILIQMVLVKT